LSGWKFVRRYPDFDLLIAVDAAGISRIFPHADDDNPSTLASKRIINIDHHRSNNSFGEVSIVDENASSTCEIIYHIYKKLGITINRFVAENLYCGIYSDTGGFVYPNTTKRALTVAAELVGLGVKPTPLVKKLNVKTLGGTLLLSEVLRTIEIERGVGSMYLTQEMLKKSRGEMLDSENFVSFLQAIGGVRVSLFLREESNGTRISLRSDGIIDVDRLARRYGGGGHRLAAGLRLKCNITAAKKKMLRAILQSLKRKS
jgi:phosphoesterase RecJ-like protein